jgi:hypothetical protein
MGVGLALSEALLGTVGAPSESSWKLVNSEGRDITIGIGKNFGVGIGEGHVYLQQIRGNTTIYDFFYLAAGGSVGISVPIPVTYNESGTDSASTGGRPMSHIITYHGDMAITAVPGPGAVISGNIGSLENTFYVAFYFFGCSPSFFQALEGHAHWKKGILGNLCEGMCLLIGQSNMIGLGMGLSYMRVNYFKPKLLTKI